MSEYLEDFKNGKMLIVCDDEDRENEGDFIISAEHCTPEIVNFIIRNSTGILCTPLSKSIAINLGLEVMCKNNNDPRSTNYTVSIDANVDNTGVSACDRCNTILELLNENPNIRYPGHIFPLIAKDNLLYEREGHTEASIALCKLSNKKPIALIAECMNLDGTMMRYNDCLEFGKKHNIKVVTVKQIKKDYINKFPLLQNDYSHIKETTTKIPINLNNSEKYFNFTVFKDVLTSREIIGISNINFNPENKDNYVRVHSGCVTANIFNSLKCDCNEQLINSLEYIYTNNGIVFYIDYHEGRGIGLFNKIKAYYLQDNNNFDTFTANHQLGFKDDERNYLFIKSILYKLNLNSFYLITNNKNKLNEFIEFNPKQFIIPSIPNKYNDKYIKDKLIHDGLVINDNNTPLHKGLYLSEYYINVDKPINICIIKTLWNKPHIDNFILNINNEILNPIYNNNINITEYEVPGSFEIPFLVKKIIDKNKFDAIICLGVLIKGETKHFEYISKSVYNSISTISVYSPIPIINGILTVLNETQISPRYSLAKGWLQSAIQMYNLNKQIEFI